jgi:hypothetical protein
MGKIDIDPSTSLWFFGSLVISPSYCVASSASFQSQSGILLIRCFFHYHPAIAATSFSYHHRLYRTRLHGWTQNGVLSLFFLRVFIFQFQTIPLGCTLGLITGIMGKRRLWHLTRQMTHLTLVSVQVHSSTLCYKISVFVSSQTHCPYSPP